MHYCVLNCLLNFFLISGNVTAHAPTAIYPTYKEDTLTVYIDHPSDEPDKHYIKTVTVLVNDVEYLVESYTTQTVDDAKGLVTYSYTVVASEGDVISVNAECSIEGDLTGTHTVGSSDKDDPNDYPDKDDPDSVGDSNKDNGEVVLLLGAIIGVLVVIIVLVAMLHKKQKGKTKKDNIKKDDWTTCPKCGSSIKMGKLPSHLDTVHTKLTRKTKDKMIDQVTKQMKI